MLRSMLNGDKDGFPVSGFTNYYIRILTIRKSIFALENNINISGGDLMRKILCLLLVAILALCLLGCAKQKPSAENNDVFTNAFFSDVVEIRDTCCGVVSAEQMEPVVQYLKGLTLTPSDTYLITVDENGETLDGCEAITFVKSNGEKVEYTRNHAKISILNVCSYVAEDENLYLGLEKAYDQALNKNTD